MLVLSTHNHTNNCPNVLSHHPNYIQLLQSPDSHQSISLFARYSFELITLIFDRIRTILFKNQMQSIDDTPLTLRIRRQKTTYFISSNPFESIDTLKRKILIFHKGLDVFDIRMYHSNKVQMIDTQLLDEKSNVHDQGIVNNSLIYYRLKKGNTNEWEELPEITL